MATDLDRAMFAGEPWPTGGRTLVLPPDDIVVLRSYAFERLNAGAALLDSDGTIVDTNEAWRLFTLLNDGEPSTTGPMTNYLEVTDRAAASGATGAASVAAGLRGLLAGDRVNFDFEYPCDSPTEERWFRLQAASAPVSGGSGVVLFHIDITANKLRERQLTAGIERDSLTGLPNRSGAHRRLAGLLTEGRGACVMFVDLDGFKSVNDTYGHHTGDELLAKVSTRLRGVVRSGDVVCRLGGDEFLVVCPELGPEQAPSLAARIREVMIPPFQVGMHSIRVGASVGWAESGPESSVESLLRSADAEMYVDKARLRPEIGERRVRSAEHAPERGRIVDELPTALPALVAAIDAAMIVVDDNGRVESWNRVAEILYGWTAHEAIGHRLQCLVGVCLDDCFEGDTGAANATSWADEVTCSHKNGATVEVRAVAIPAYDSWGRPCGGVVLSRIVDRPPTSLTAEPLLPLVDTSSHRQTAPPLTGARLAAAVHRSTDVAMFFEGDGTIAWVSPSCTDIFGVPPHELVGRCGFDLIHPDDSERVITAFAEGLTEPAVPVRVEFRLDDPDGAVRWVEETVADLTADPEVGYMVANLRDVTERKVAEGAMERLALVDDLTGLPNRNALVMAIDRLEEDPDSSSDGGLILFDLDNFCDVNDTLGHCGGDALIVAVAQRVRSKLPDELLVARYGGDQFAIFGRALSAPQICSETVAIVRTSLASPIQIDGHDLIASATTGIAATQRGGRELIRNADAALYHAKKTNRGGTVHFQPHFADEAARRLRRAGDLRSAVSRGEIVAHYHPVIELQTGRAVAVEALARWNHPEHGWVPPDEFVLLAESTGLIEELGQQIVEQSCADAAEWLRHDRRLQLAVNASGVQLSNPTFAATIRAALTSTGLPPSQLTIEITETAALSDSMTALAVLTELKALGVTLSLDDFGTGYSPLAALRDLPADAIKLDRTFVAGLGSAAGDCLTSGIVQLGVALGMHVVAEGVETQSQADHLRRIGCAHGQGYLWSPAVPGADLLATIARIELAGGRS